VGKKGITTDRVGLAERLEGGSQGGGKILKDWGLRVETTKGWQEKWVGVAQLERRSGVLRRRGKQRGKEKKGTSLLSE